MKAKEFIQQNTHYIIDFIIFLIIFTCFILAYYFLVQRIKNYTGTENTIASTQNTYSRNDQTIETFQKSNISLQAFNDALPTEKTIVNWVSQTETMASLAQVTQTLSFNAGELTKGHIIVPQQTGTQPYITAVMTVTGKYSQILTYISLLQNSYYYTRIDSINFSLNRAALTSGASIQATQQPVNQTAPVIASITVDLFISDAQVTTGTN